MVVHPHDPRHVNVLVKEIGIDSANTVGTPAADDTASVNAETLEPEPFSK